MRIALALSVWLTAAMACADQPAMKIKADPKAGFHEIWEGSLPVLRYNHATVPVPRGIDPKYARGDYLHPLYGLDGEVLTDDYPKDHPHHRGVGWSWPVTRWKGEVRDIWAVSGVWSRPVAMRRCEATHEAAVLEAENVWKWGDTTPIVREEVVIRALPKAANGRLIDVQVRLTGLEDGVAIGGRPHAGYGGFGLRAAPAQQRKITLHQDASPSGPPRVWLDYSGVFSGGKGLAGVAIFEHPGNPGYPSQLKEYAGCNYAMPAFPGEREVPLPKQETLVLNHRLLIHRGGGDEKVLSQTWAAYAAKR